MLSSHWGQGGDTVRRRAGGTAGEKERGGWAESGAAGDESGHCPSGTQTCSKNTL